MAISFVAAQVIGRSAGRSSVAAAAYRAGVTLIDERTGEVHDFTRKDGVREAFILAPANAPAWMKDRAQLWNGVERSEKRKDSQLARELVVALPHELPHETRRALVVDWVRAEFVGRGMVADVALHAPSREGDSRNEHAHIMLTMRSIEGDAFGKKVTAWNDGGLLEAWKDSWAARANAALEKHQISARIDARSHEQQAVAAGHDVSLANLSSLHLGPAAARLERRGIRTVPGDLNREIRIVNLELERARREARKEAVPPSPAKPQQRECLQGELQALLQFPKPPTAEMATAEIQRQRRELEARTDARMKQDRELQYREMQARLAAGQMQEIEQRRVELLTRGRDLKNQIRQQKRRGRAIEKWTEKHPLRARLLLGLGVFSPGMAVRLMPPDTAGLFADFRQAGREHQELQEQREAAQETATEAQAAAERERMRVEQEAATAVAEASQRLDQAEELAADLQRVEQEQPQPQFEPAIDAPRPAPRLRMRGPTPGMS